MVAQARDGGPVVDRRRGADGPRDRAADDRVGDHRGIDTPSGAGGDGRARRAGGGRAGPVHPRLRDVEDLPQQHEDADEEDARADARRSDDRARRAFRRALRLRRRHVERGRAGARGRCACAARGAAGVRRRDRAEDAGTRRRDRGRLPDAVDHHARIRPLHVREREGGHRHRLHGRRLDPCHRSRRGPRRRARDRGHVPREQGAEHPRRRRHAARPRRARAGRDPPRRRGDGGGRSPRRQGEGERRDARQVPPIAGTPADCIAAIEEYKDAGCTHVMLELWGDDRLEQIRLFGEQVLPHVR